MEALKCNSIRDKVLGAENICVLLVSDGCPFCDEVLANFKKLKLSVDTIIVSTDACYDTLETWVEYAATPMILQFMGGRKVAEATGLDDILRFEPKLAAPVAPSGGSVPVADKEVAGIE